MRTHHCPQIFCNNDKQPQDRQTQAGGVQGHAGQLTTCPVPDRVDKIPACFYL